jgi:hypothetical protein
VDNDVDNGAARADLNACEEPEGVLRGVYRPLQLEHEGRQKEPCVVTDLANCSAIPHASGGGGCSLSDFLLAQAVPIASVALVPIAGMAWGIPTTGMTRGYFEPYNSREGRSSLGGMVFHVKR